MPFNRELEDFAGSFSKGYSMVRSPDEREAQRTETEYNKGKLDLLREELTPEGKERRRRESEANLGLAEAQTSGAIERTKTEAYENSEARREARRAAEEADIAYKEAETARLRLAADKDNVALQQESLMLENEAKRMANRAAKYELELEDLFRSGSSGSESLIEGAPAGAVSTSDRMVPDENAVHPGVGPVRRKGVTYGDEEEAPAAVPMSDDPKGDTGSALNFSSMDPALGDTGLPGVRLNRGQVAIEDFMRGFDPSARGTPAADEATKTTHEAAREGMKYLMSASGLDQDYAVGTPEFEQQQTDFLTNVNASSPETVEMVKDVIQEKEPGREMSNNEKNRKALAYGYNFYMQHGRPDKAKRFAAGMMGHFQHMAGQYGAFAQAAASEGDPDAAGEALMRAYEYIPSGNILKVTKKGNGYNLTIEPEGGGKLIHQQVMSPQEIMGAAMQITPASFVPMMEQALGIESKTVGDAFVRDNPEYEDYTPEEVRIAESRKNKLNKSTTAGGKKAVDDVTATPGVKPENRGTFVKEDLDPALDALETAAPGVYGDPDQTMSEVIPGAAPAYYKANVKRAAFDIAARTSDVMIEDAVEVGARLTKARPSHVKKLGSDILEVTFDGLPAVRMHKQVYDSMSDLRNKIERPLAAQREARSDTDRQEAEEQAGQDAKISKRRDDKARREAVRAEKGWDGPLTQPDIYPLTERIGDIGAGIVQHVTVGAGGLPSKVIPPGPTTGPGATDAGLTRLQSDIGRYIPSMSTNDFTTRANDPNMQSPTTPTVVTPRGPVEAVPTGGGGMSMTINPNPAPRAPFIRPNPEDYPFPSNPY